MKNMKIAVIGLGYVGMPLAVEFSKKDPVVGFDINEARVKELQGGSDRTREIDSSSLKEVLSLSDTNHAIGLKLSHDIEALHDCNFFIVTVPTPITKFKTPDLKPLLGASSTVGKVLKKGDIVVSGSTPEIADRINELYSSIIKAGTFKASCIKVAEACKAIENAQRDVNISFMNELALIFDKMGIDTQEVLDAAATKWNFLKFAPGLVGGHCIGVDPYYLLHKSQCLGYNPQVILSGRTVNNEMGRFVASKTVKLMIRHGIKIVGSKVLVLGFTFKENCPDTRNTKVVDIIDELKDFGVDVDVYDPYALRDEVKEEYGVELLEQMSDIKKYDGIILAVAHDEFKQLDFGFVRNQPTVLFDVKGVLDKSLVHGRL